MSKHQFTIETDSRQDMAKRLRAAANGFDTASFRSWKFWIGFLWGMILMATLNVGDVHVCVGECDSAGFALLGGEGRP